MKHSGEFHNGV